MSQVEKKRIISIDFGEKRVGLAITDPLHLFAYPLVTLPNDLNLLNKIKDLIAEYDCGLVILGFPLKESGEHSRITNKVLSFREQLAGVISIPVEMVDERYSSSIAKERIIQSVASKKKRRDKSLLDKNAAAVILED